MTTFQLCPDDLSHLDEPTPVHDALTAQLSAARVAADYETEAASVDPLRRAALLEKAARLRVISW